MRSAYACGALLGFQDAGLRFDAVYGTSAGGAAGAWYAQGCADGFARTFEYARDPRILNLRRAGLRRGPYLDLDYLVDEVYPTEGFDRKRLAATKQPTIVTATTTQGQGRYLDLRHVDPHQGLKATMCLPLIAGPPVAINGDRFVDGGVTDPLPVARAIRDGHRDLVLVLNRSERRRRNEGRPVAWVLGRYHPELARLSLVHHRLVMDSVRLAENPPDGVRVRILRPERPTGVSRFTKDIKQLRRVIAQAREDAGRFLSQSDRQS